jgi:hypothetical protein
MYIKHPMHPAGYLQVQLTEFVSNITPPLDSVRVTIQPEDQAIRVRDDGIDPTNATGLHIANGATYVLDSDTKSLRLISEASTTPAVAANAVILSGPANSDLTFTATDTGPEWNAYTFETVQDAVAPANATATLDSAAVNSDITFTSESQSASWNGYTFTTIADANAGANATANLASAAANSDLLFTSISKDDSWNNYDFETVDDVVAGVNADATLGINAANGDLVFTAPATGASYNGTNFTANSAGAESITYSAPNFALNYNAATSNGATMKAAFDAALGANPTWPQWSCADEGDGSGTWDVVDDDATIVSANGVTEQLLEVTYATNTFTIHIDSGVTNAAQVDTVWGTGPAECSNWACAAEGDGSGVVDVANTSSAGGIDVVDPYIVFAANTFTIHILSTTVASELVTLWGAVGAPANCANWAVVNEGAGGGVVDATTDTSANGATAVAPSIDYASSVFTIHTIPAVTTAANVVTLWAAGPAECINWSVVAEGAGGGVVDAANGVSANGVDAVGALVNLLWHKEL